MKKDTLVYALRKHFSGEPISVAGRCFLEFLTTNECKIEVKLDEDCIVFAYGGVLGTFATG